MQRAGVLSLFSHPYTIFAVLCASIVFRLVFGSSIVLIATIVGCALAAVYLYARSPVHNVGNVPQVLHDNSIAIGACTTFLAVAYFRGIIPAVGYACVALSMHRIVISDWDTHLQEVQERTELTTYLCAVGITSLALVLCALLSIPTCAWLIGLLTILASLVQGAFSAWSALARTNPAPGEWLVKLVGPVSALLMLLLQFPYKRTNYVTMPVGYLALCLLAGMDCIAAYQERERLLAMAKEHGEFLVLPVWILAYSLLMCFTSSWRWDRELAYGTGCAVIADGVWMGTSVVKSYLQNVSRSSNDPEAFDRMHQHVNLDVVGAAVVAAAVVFGHLQTLAATVGLVAIGSSAMMAWVCSGALLAASVLPARGTETGVAGAGAGAGAGAAAAFPSTLQVALLAMRYIKSSIRQVIVTCAVALYPIRRFDCSVCANNLDEALRCKTPLCCAESVCVACFCEYVRTACGDASRFPLKCPCQHTDLSLDHVHSTAVLSRDLAAAPNASGFGADLNPLDVATVTRFERFSVERAVAAAERSFCPSCESLNLLLEGAGPTTWVRCAYCAHHYRLGGVRAGAETRPPGQNQVVSAQQANEETDAFIRATSKQCPRCPTLISHFHGHACHHISPGAGCPGCSTHFCFACLGTDRENAGCTMHWSRFCKASDVPEHTLLLPYPHDSRCGCRFCPDCKRGDPCRGCDGTCVVCRGVVPPGPRELASASLGRRPQLSVSEGAGAGAGAGGLAALRARPGAAAGANNSTAPPHPPPPEAGAGQSFMSTLTRLRRTIGRRE